jgi:hypothetical protein
MACTRQSRRRQAFEPRPAPTSFKLIFLTVTTGCVFCVCAAATLAIYLPVTTPNQQKVFDALLAGFSLGVGAILGLLGGKSTK